MVQGGTIVNIHTLLNKYVLGARNSVYYYSTHIAEVTKPDTVTSLTDTDKVHAC